MQIMIHIEVLGSGCPTCKKLFEVTQQAAHLLDTPATVTYITGMDATKRILELGVMGSPVLVVDGSVALVGSIPDVEKIKAKIIATQKKK